jgi:predicted phosphodiesterase
MTKLILPPGLKPPALPAIPVKTHKLPAPVRMLVTGDWHYPIVDSYYENAIMKFASDWKADLHVDLGDRYDLYSVSSFEQEPTRTKSYGGRLQEEFDAAVDNWKELCSISKNVAFILGNHENRLSRLISHNAGLFGLKALQWENIAGIPKKVKIYPYGTILNVGGISIHHGDTIGGKFGVKNPADWALSNLCESTIFGHFHQSQTIYRTIRRNGELKNIVACAQGHGSILSKQTYVRNPTWSHGATAVEYWTEGGKPRFTVHPIVVVKGRFMFSGKVYDGHKG